VLVYPVYLRDHRGDYASVAAEIETLTAGSPLYANDVVGDGFERGGQHRLAAISPPTGAVATGRVVVGLSHREASRTASAGTVVRKFRWAARRCTCPVPGNGLRA
jgi:hypothetical protein